MSEALWGGRFSRPLAEVSHRFSSSIAEDRRLYRYDIAGSIAHTKGLVAAGILTNDEGAAIIDGLHTVEQEIDAGAFVLDASMEDVHLAIERRLTEIVGPIGGKLHTGRSRNDQVATDVRLYERDGIDAIAAALHTVQRSLLHQASQHTTTLVPGYTHTQRAQPIVLAHHLLAYVEMFGRDGERLRDARSRVNRSPLGSAAFAGTSYPIDRRVAAGALGFDGVLANSIDAVSDRDHLIEVVAACSIIMMHLSRLAEELVVWSSSEFGFVVMSDAVTTGSSIMPQKKNPDMAELTRGKVGRVYGDLLALLTMMKGLPLAYNRDMQEDKAPLFDAIDTTHATLEMMGYMLLETTFQSAQMSRAAKSDQLLATEVADYLARKGMPFRDAHEVAGKMVAEGVARERSLCDFTTREFQQHSSLFAEDIHDFLDPWRSVSEKRTMGSTNPEFVRAEIERWSAVLGPGGVGEHSGGIVR